MLCDQTFYDWDNHVLSPQYPQILVGMTNEMGIPQNELLHRACINENMMRSMNVRFSGREFIALVQAAIDLSNNDDLGIEFGKIMDLSANGFLTSLLMSSENLMVALEHTNRYAPINGYRIECFIKRHQHIAMAFLPVLQEYTEPVRKFFVESILVSWNLQAKTLLRKPVKYQKIILQNCFSNSTKKLSQELNCDIELNGEENIAVFDINILKERLPTANPITQKVQEAACQEMLRKSFENQSLTWKIFDLIRRHEDPHPTADTIANQLTMSVRSMTKNLKDEGSSYSKILNEVLTKKAILYIRYINMSVADTADRLGFSDASNFRRAFKSWTGQPPSFYQNKNL